KSGISTINDAELHVKLANLYLNTRHGIEIWKDPNTTEVSPYSINKLHFGADSGANAGQNNIYKNKQAGIYIGFVNAAALEANGNKFGTTDSDDCTGSSPRMLTVNNTNCNLTYDLCGPTGGGNGMSMTFANVDQCGKAVCNQSPVPSQCPSTSP